MRTLTASPVDGWTDHGPRDVTVLVARTSSGPARRRLPLAVASRALTAVRGDRALTGQRF